MLAIIFKYYTPGKKKTHCLEQQKITITDDQIKGMVALTLFFNIMQIYFTKCIISSNTTEGGVRNKLRNKSMKTKLTYVTSYKHFLSIRFGRSDPVTCSTLKTKIYSTNNLNIFI